MTPQRPRIDFNCDLGEGCGDDAAIVPCITSASIACGGHAGDEASMRATVALCRDHGVAVGAHPSFDDRAGFGRVEQAIPSDAAHALVTRQVAALARICADTGTPLRHVKPHGALYNLSARDRGIAHAIAAAVRDFDPSLRLYGLAGSASIDAARALGVDAVEEVFAERRYEADGLLTPRTHADAVIHGLDASLAQVRTMLRDGAVVARTGQRVPIRAQTLCLHGDRPDAAGFAHALRAALEGEGVDVSAPGAPVAAERGARS